ncbi:MAG: EF-P 5-aminopentanol modification-associated protein YfmH [Bacilli bacterium]
MRETRYERLQETIFHERLENGLRVYIMPKHGYRQTYASFTTRYGSIDSEFTEPAEQTRRRVPDGIAHFLEHKMFEEEHGDVFMDFARTGAQANAFTTFDSTTYLFSCTTALEDNLDILLNFVQHPYFTDENVEKEKGIIGQEIKMYEDNPNWRVYFQLLQAFYGAYPAAVDIAGTIHSIAAITKEDLYHCYRTFYHPSNMILVVVGDVDPESVVQVVRANQESKSYEPQAAIQRFYPPLPEYPGKDLAESRLAIAQPRVLFGFKERRVDSDPERRQRREAAMELWLDALLGHSSDLYQALIDDGLTDQGFSTEYELTRLYGHSVFGGNSKQPRELVDRVRGALREFAQTGVSETDFERSKRKAIGRFLALLDSPQGIANVFTAQKLRDMDILAALDALTQLELDDLNAILREHVDDTQFAASIVWPEESKAGAASD